MRRVHNENYNMVLRGWQLATVVMIETVATGGTAGSGCGAVLTTYGFLTGLLTARGFLCMWNARAHL